MVDRYPSWYVRKGLSTSETNTTRGDHNILCAQILVLAPTDADLNAFAAATPGGKLWNSSKNGTVYITSRTSCLSKVALQKDQCKILLQLQQQDMLRLSEATHIFMIFIGISSYSYITYPRMVSSCDTFQVGKSVPAHINLGILEKSYAGYLFECHFIFSPLAGTPGTRIRETIYLLHMYMRIDNSGCWWTPPGWTKSEPRLVCLYRVTSKGSRSWPTSWLLNHG